MNKPSTLLLLLVLYALPAAALPEDSEQPIDLEAVSWDFLIDENLTIYEGTEEHPVVVTQGTLRVTGLNLEGRGILDQQVPLYLEATSEPARFQIQPRADKGILYGSGNRLVYDELADQFTATTQARLEIDDHVVTGDHITYDITPSIITATAANSASRVYVEIPTEDGLLKGYAQKAVYQEAEGLVTLEGSACLQMQDVVFRGHYASFDLNTNRGSARGENDSDIIRINDQEDTCE